MRVLLDTHIFLWLVDRPERIGGSVLDTLQDPKTTLYFSVASAWEIAIKFRIRKLGLPEEPATWLPKRISSLGLLVLPVTLEHAIADTRLPRVHGDPFDRMLIAQAGVEELTLCTADSKLAEYPAELLFVT